MIDQQQITSVVIKELPAGSVIIEVKKLEISYGHACWLIETTKGSYLLKIPVRHSSSYDFNNEVRAHQLLIHYGLPVPELVSVCPAPNDLEVPFLIQRWLLGEDGVHALTHFSSHETEIFAYDFGRAVAQMHHIPGEAFCEDVLNERSFPSWKGLCETRLTNLLEANRRVALLPLEVLRTIEKRCLNLLNELAYTMKPQFTHRDLYLPNTLVDHQGHFVSLLDFEAARFYDSLWDFVKLDAWVFHIHLALRAPFLAGYASASSWPEDAAERIFLYQAIEYLAAFPYFGERFPNEIMLRNFHTLILEWVAGSPNSIRNWGGHK